MTQYLSINRISEIYQGFEISFSRTSVGLNKRYNIARYLYIFAISIRFVCALLSLLIAVLTLTSMMGLVDHDPLFGLSGLQAEIAILTGLTLYIMTLRVARALYYYSADKELDARLWFPEGPALTRMITKEVVDTRQGQQIDLGKEVLAILTDLNKRVAAIGTGLIKIRTLVVKKVDRPVQAIEPTPGKLYHVHVIVPKQPTLVSKPVVSPTTLEHDLTSPQSSLKVTTSDSETIALQALQSTLEFLQQPEADHITADTVGVDRLATKKRTRKVTASKTKSAKAKSTKTMTSRMTSQIPSQSVSQKRRSRTARKVKVQ